MAIENEDLLAEMKGFRVEHREDMRAFQRQNAAEHILINDGIAGCRERIGKLEGFKDDTKPRLNGMSARLASVNEEKAKTSATIKILLTLAMLAAGGLGGFLFSKIVG